MYGHVPLLSRAKWKATSTPASKCTPILYCQTARAYSKRFVSASSVSSGSATGVADVSSNTHGLLIALEGISSVVLDGLCGYSCRRIWGLVLLHRRHSTSCHRRERYCVLVRPVVCRTVERYPGIGYRPVQSFHEGLLVSRNIRSSAGPWQSVQASSKRGVVSHFSSWDVVELSQRVLNFDERGLWTEQFALRGVLFTLRLCDSLSSMLTAPSSRE